MFSLKKMPKLAYCHMDTFIIFGCIAKLQLLIYTDLLAVNDSMWKGY